MGYILRQKLEKTETQFVTSKQLGDWEVGRNRTRTTVKTDVIHQERQSKWDFKKSMVNLKHKVRRQK